MEGRTCDKCKRSFFNLQSEEPEGCVPCFCFGLTSDCKCANYYKDTVRMSPSLSDLQSSPVVSRAVFCSCLFQIAIFSSVLTSTLNFIPTIGQSNCFFSEGKNSVIGLNHFPHYVFFFISIRFKEAGNSFQHFSNSYTSKYEHCHC